MEIESEMCTLTRIVHCGLAVMVLFAVGCSGAGGPKLAPVKGKVTVGGTEPYKKGLVRFLPKPGTKLNSREAVTDDNGNYTILFNAKQPGLEPGAYTVMFSLYQMPDGGPMEDQMGEPYPKEPKDLGAVQFVPPEFAMGTSEECSVTISDKGGAFDFDIPELKAQVGRRK